MRLKDIREDHDISQEKMAKILRVKRSTYSLWELGINIIPLDNLCDFADYFQYSIDYVLGFSQNKGSKNIKKGFDLKILGQNMRKIRIENHLSQENIGNMLKVTQACIAKYENGLICISTSNLCKFCKEFKISLSEICGKSNKERS